MTKARSIVLVMLWSMGTAVLVLSLLTRPALAADPQIEAPGAGTVRALVIGINKYQFEPTLRGAVADARDIAGVLRDAGVHDLTLLLNAAATRGAVVSAIERLIRVSKRGDLDIISYAGHGAQEPERVKGSEPDGKDEIIVLAGFSPSGPGTRQRIIDDEINHWLSRLDDKGVRVIFIADTCHGGGLTRGIDLRAEPASYRSLGLLHVSGDELKPISTKADSHLTYGSFKHVTFLAAVNKYSVAPEIRINGHFRGALSYAFARAVQGALGNGGVAKITRGKLFGYTRQVVYDRSDTRQNIVTQPNEDTAELGAVVFRLKGSGERSAAPPIKMAPVALRIINGDAAALGGVRLDPSVVHLVPAGQWWDIAWDVARGEVINPFSDPIAHGVTAADLQSVAARTAVVNAIDQMTERRPQTVRLLPNDRRHHDGERVSVHLGEMANRYLVLFDIAGDGTVQFLYPFAEDRPIVKAATFDLPLVVKPPYGADCLIAVTSAKSLTRLQAKLRSLDGNKAPVAALQALETSSQQISVGYAGLFTAR